MTSPRPRTELADLIELLSMLKAAALDAAMILTCPCARPACRRAQAKLLAHGPVFQRTIDELTAVFAAIKKARGGP